MFNSLLALALISAGSCHPLDAGHHDRVARQSSTTNPLMIQGFEWYSQKDGNHWSRLTSQLPRFASLGISTIWIPPATKAGNNPSTGYDVYDLWDLGEFNQKGTVRTSYGTKSQLEKLSTDAAAQGISLIADGVLNQRSGAEKSVTCTAHQVSNDNRLQSTSSSQQIKAWVGFEYAGRSGKYSSKKWGCDDFSAVDYDDTSKAHGIWKIEGQNNGFATDVSKEHGNYDYLVLADVAYANPSVQEDTKAWGKWIANTLSLGGFRLDAAKHISKAFMIDFVNSVKTAYPNLLIVAEYLTGDASEVQSYVSGFKSAISVFDTTVQSRFVNFSKGKSTDLRKILDNTWLSISPGQSVTYVNNHDTQPGQAIDSQYVTGTFTPLAYAIALLRRDGLPCLFHGDIFGHSNGDGSFTSATYGGIITDLAMARKYFAYGTQRDYFVSASTIGWVREGDQARPEGLAVVMTIGNYNEIEMNVGKQHADEVWSSLFGGSGQVTIKADGTAKFVAGAGTVNIYTRADAKQRGEFGKWDARF